MKPKRTFVSVITLISITGVLLGVAVLWVVVSVMSGFEREIKNLLLGFEPHIVAFQAFPEDPDEPDPLDWYDVLDQLRANPAVAAASPFVAGQVLLVYFEQPLAPLLRGIDPDDVQQMDQFRELLIEGELDLSGEAIVVSKSVAVNLALGVGDWVTVYSPKNIDEAVRATRRRHEASAANGPPDTPTNGSGEAEEEGTENALAGEGPGEGPDEVILPKELEVRAVIDSPYLIPFVMVSLEAAQELYQLEGAVNGIGITSPDPYHVDVTAAALNLPWNWRSETWMENENNSRKLQAVRLERITLSVLLFFIILVGAFCIMNTMIIVTVQKRREIGVLKAIGARTAQIVMVFVGQGMIVGVLGTLAGLGVGALVLHYRNLLRDFMARFLHIEILPESVYGITELPAQVVPAHIMIISAGAFLLCTLAALPPAYFVARMDAARALRNEGG
ncbi:MAG TPA: FtsX-like permease family protein [Verrucomicrobiales bacterium]|nr:FtsX-like permease family protein [Verrucomicrobiales bacterium]